MNNKWCEPLLSCVEGLYIVEEKSKKIVWASPYITEGIKDKCVGELCYKAFLGKDEMCPFCPALAKEDGVYTWDYFETRYNRWMKIKNHVFEMDGVLYRAGNINMIDDVMRLNYDTIKEISAMQKILDSNENEMKSLTKEAIYDSLTGLLNRNCFQVDLEQIYTKVSGLGVMFFDLNNLKDINDKYRHSAGDILLKRMADVLRKLCGQVAKARCYRIGGDEFVLLMSDTTEERLESCASLFAEYMDDYNRGMEHLCSVAVGLAFSKEKCDPELLISKADKEMYRVKKIMKGE